MSKTKPKPDLMDEEFVVLRLTRRDFATVGFDASQVDSETMAHYARKLGECEPVMNTFWEWLSEIGEDDNLPKDQSAIKERLEYLRGEIREERISYGELVELQSLAEHIDPDDVELLQCAGVPEFPEE